MDIEQLRQLDAIERHGTMSAAAAELMTTQPSLSKSMRRLERDLGAELFDRSPNRVRLNEAGLVALRHARTILAEERLMRDDFAALARRKRTLKVLTVAPAPSWRLAELTAGCFPDVILDPQIAEAAGAQSALMNREADLAILAAPPQMPDMRSVRLMTEDLFLNAPAGSPLAVRSSISFADLDGEAFLILEQIGLWMDAVRRSLPNSQIIVQKDRVVFEQLAASTSLLTFTTNVPQNQVEASKRTAVPIVDADAHATFFLCVRDDAQERAREIFEAVGESADEGQ